MRGDFIDWAVFFVRQAEGAWRLSAVKCPRGGFDHVAQRKGWRTCDLDMLGYCSVLRGIDPVGVSHEWARKDGWEQDNATGLYYPIEQPFPLGEGAPVEEPISFSFAGISVGYIYCALEVGNAKLHFDLCDLSADLYCWVRFVNLLNSGLLPHANLAHGVSIKTGEASNANHIRICVDGYFAKANEDFEKHHPMSFDLLMKRDDLVASLRQFLRALAEEPSLGVFWVRTDIEESDAEYDRLKEEVDQQLQAQGGSANALESRWKIEAEVWGRRLGPKYDELPSVQAFRRMLLNLDETELDNLSNDESGVSTGVSGGGKIRS